MSLIKGGIFLSLLFLGGSCAKQMDDRSTSSVPVDSVSGALREGSPAVSSPSVTELDTIFPDGGSATTYSSGSIPDSVRQLMMQAQKELPPGALPQIKASVLKQFQPTLPGYYVAREANNEHTGISRSIHLYRNKADTTKTVRCMVIDQDERTASTLIKEIGEIQKKGYRDSYSEDGEPLRAHYTTIKGLPAMWAVIPSQTVATLTILCGGHRIVALREYKTNSVDNLRKIAETMDLVKLSEMMP